MDMYLVLVFLSGESASGGGGGDAGGFWVDLLCQYKPGGEQVQLLSCLARKASSNDFLQTYPNRIPPKLRREGSGFWPMQLRQRMYGEDQTLWNVP